MQPVAEDKITNTREHHFLQKLWQLKSNLRRTNEKKGNMVDKSSSPGTNLLIETFMEGSLTASALRKTEPQLTRHFRPISIFPPNRPIRFPLQEAKCIVLRESNFLRERREVLENKTYDSEEKIKSFCNLLATAVLNVSDETSIHQKTD